MALITINYIRTYGEAVVDIFGARFSDASIRQVDFIKY